MLIHRTELMKNTFHENNTFFSKLNNEIIKIKNE